MDIISEIAEKLEVAHSYGGNSLQHTTIRLVFKPGEILTEEDEKRLLELTRKEIKPEQTYVCCNRSWQARKFFEAFFHLLDFDVEQKTYQRMAKEFKIR